MLLDPQFLMHYARLAQQDYITGVDVPDELCEYWGEEVAQEYMQWMVNEEAIDAYSCEQEEEEGVPGSEGKEAEG